METKKVHISTIKAGDTIIHEGVLSTVSAKNIQTGGFFGTTIFGDSYRAGTVAVEKIIKF